MDVGPSHTIVQKFTPHTQKKQSKQMFCDDSSLGLNVKKKKKNVQ